MTETTPNTFIVGAGPVATSLAGALRLGGVPVLGLWARSAAPARSAGAVAGVAAFSAAPPDLLLEADVIVLAVRDDAVAEVAAQLLATGLVTKHHVMLHCSGAIPSDTAFGAVRDRLGGVGTLHPLRAIPDGRDAMRDLRGTVFGVEGDDVGRRQALALVAALGGHPLILEGEQMAAYHAAAALMSNQFVALLAVASELLESVGIAEKEALEALAPLVEGALENVRDKGLAGGLTGPIRRGDVATVERHLSAVEGLPDHVGAVYRELSLRTLAIAKQAGTDAEALKAMEQRLLGQGPALRRATGK